MLPVGPAVAEALRQVAFATDAQSRSVLAMTAAALGWPAPEIREGGLEAAHAYVAATAAPAFLVVDLSDSAAPLGGVDALAEVCAADTKVLAIGTRNDVELFRGLRALGVSDYLLKPLDPTTLRLAMQAMLADGPAGAELQRNQAPHKAEILAFMGARGGAGVTTVAISAAALLAQDYGKRVVLLDLDLQAGTAALDLEAEPSPGLASLLESPDRVDQLLVNASLRPHDLGFALLTAEEPIDQLLRVKADAVLALIAAVATEADVIVVDLPRRLDRSVRAVLRTADRVVIVTPATLVGMRETRRVAGFVTGLRAGQRPMVIVNRVGETSAEVGRADFEQGIGGRIDIMLPHAPRQAARATEQATALVKVSGRGALGVGLRSLAALLASGPPAARSEPAGWRARLKHWLLR